ncbi:hypothetical protein [Streptomyces roseolilacinus]
MKPGSRGSGSDGRGSAGRFTCDGREPWYSYGSGGRGADVKPGGRFSPPLGRDGGGGGEIGVYEVAVLVRKFHRHSSQNGALASRGVRHCGHSSACRVAFGSPPAGPG